MRALNRSYWQHKSNVGFHLKVAATLSNQWGPSLTKHGVRLHITEFGTTRSNVDGKGGGPDRRGRLLYTRDMVDAMKKYGITWTYSQWRDWDGITKKYIHGKDSYNYRNRLLDPAMIKRLKR